MKRPAIVPLCGPAALQWMRRFDISTAVASKMSRSRGRGRTVARRPNLPGLAEIGESWMQNQSISDLLGGPKGELRRVAGAAKSIGNLLAAQPHIFPSALDDRPTPAYSPGANGLRNRRFETEARRGGSSRMQHARVIRRYCVHDNRRIHSWRERNGCGRIVFADSPWKVWAPPVSVKPDGYRQ
jgi:hypothetical protein